VVGVRPVICRATRARTPPRRIRCCRRRARRPDPRGLQARHSRREALPRRPACPCRGCIRSGMGGDGRVLAGYSTVSDYTRNATDDDVARSSCGRHRSPGPNHRPPGTPVEV